MSTEFSRVVNSGSAALPLL